LESKKKRNIKCWDFFKCKEIECPVFKSKDHRCWLYSETHCREQIQGKFLEKMEMCLDCVPFKSNIEHASLKATLKVINDQFKEYKRIVTETDEELRSISMELAISLSEVFEALRKISSGDNAVRLYEKSKIELIGKLKHVVNLTAQEIRRAEETLRFTQFAIDHTADAAFWMTSDARFVYVNEAACRLLGYSRNELLTMTFYDIDPMFSKEVWAAHWKVLKQLKTFTFESVHKAKDGRIFPVEITVNFVEFKGKEYNCAFARDITKRKRMLEKLQESEEKYRRLFFIETDAIVIFDAETLQFVDVNDAALRIYGYTRDELLNLERLDISAEPVKSIEWIQKILSGDVIWIPLDYHKKKDGTIFPVEISAGSFILKGHRVGFEAIKDITLRKHAEDELKKSYENLRALSTRITEIQETERRSLSRELHDQVGQNLTALSVNLDFLIEHLSSETRVSLGSRLKDCKVLVKEIMKPIRNIMSDLRPRILDDYGLVAAIHWYTDQFSNRTKIPVMFKGKDLDPRLPSDVETNLFRVIQESLTNIVKHAHASRVTVYLEETEGKVKLTINDDGVGFDPLSINKTTERKGFGLIGMRERAEASGGKLSVISSPGKGTQVIVEIKR
jgi:PAS domain S-box-containing protein